MVYAHKDAASCPKKMNSAAREPTEEREWFCHARRVSKWGPLPCAKGVKAYIAGFNTHVMVRRYVKEVRVPCTGASPGKPVVVLTDGHKSQVDLESLQYAKDHNVHFFLFPPHSTHLLCALECGCITCKWHGNSPLEILGNPHLST